MHRAPVCLHLADRHLLGELAALRRLAGVSARRSAPRPVRVERYTDRSLITVRSISAAKTGAKEERDDQDHDARQDAGRKAKRSRPDSGVAIPSRPGRDGTGPEGETQANEDRMPFGASVHMSAPWAVVDPPVLVFRPHKPDHGRTGHQQDRDQQRLRRTPRQGPGCKQNNEPEREYNSHATPSAIARTNLISGRSRAAAGDRRRRAGSVHRDFVVIESQTPPGDPPSRPGLWRWRHAYVTLIAKAGAAASAGCVSPTTFTSADDEAL